MTIWLPSLLSTLVSLRSDPLTRSKLIVWRGESFVQPGCEEMGGARSSDNSAEASGLDVDTTYPWVLFYNVQGRHPRPRSFDPRLNGLVVLLQSLILRDILPHVGIPYLPLPYAALLHPARDDLANPARFPREKTENLTREAHCATYDMDEAFLRGLARVLQTRS
ncbi:hypothetical protein BOTBODRAFT_39129 [Botryobasidium botryosum FD-172 SS1]|uniref:Uncharacterized protein n=1 Tax=Botryobasidium botryosum (strain FD-172 SS1) TaxID=930990 RepID=A0A067LVB0_BOTB1|nr:hypothetical protein BOTBODRAFT_39129 [Botryobasidium botryosum FD-172 SS1]